MNYDYAIVILRGPLTRVVGGFTSYSQAENFVVKREISFYVILPIEHKDKW